MGKKCCGESIALVTPSAPEIQPPGKPSDLINESCCSGGNADQAVSQSSAVPTAIPDQCCLPSAVCREPNESVGIEEESGCECCSPGSVKEDDGCEDGCCADICDGEAENALQGSCRQVTEDDDGCEDVCCADINGETEDDRPNRCRQVETRSATSSDEACKVGCCSANQLTDEAAAAGQGCCSTASQGTRKPTCCNAEEQDGKDLAVSKGCCQKDLQSPRPTTCCTSAQEVKRASDDCCAPGDGDDSGSAMTGGCCGGRSSMRAADDISDSCCTPKPKTCCDQINSDTGDDCCTRSVAAKGCCDKVAEPQSVGSASLRQRKKKSPAWTNKSTVGKKAIFAPQKEPMCPCCVETMLKTNLNALEILISRVSEAHSRFKRCCIAFANLCCAKSRTDDGCCESSCDGTSCTDEAKISTFTPHSKSVLEVMEVERKPLDGSVESEIAAPDGQKKEERVVLEVIGMDCPDCLSKVTRAVRVLAGAQVVNADALRGLVDVTYDPNRIDLKAIQTFTARASGFTINALSDHPSDKGKTLILPLTFETMPPSQALEGYGVHDHNPLRDGRWYWPTSRANDKGGQIELVLPLNPDDPPIPRDVMERLAPYKPTLRSHREDKNEDRINRDLLHISLRTLASLVLTIPILVLVWSPTPLVSSVTSQSVQLGLATAIVVVAWPVYSGSFRSAYYLHRADLGVLTSFSTLTSYIFSVIAFGFELAGRNIGDPFFETVGLLITLIFAGRTLQASTRRLGLGAVRNLGRLQPEHSRLVSGQGELLIDVRLLHYDDVLFVKTGEVIPTDGIVLKGEATADESSLTGESLPVSKSRGSSVTAGTRITSGSIEMAVTRLVPENAISAISDAVNSTSTGSDYQDLADRLAGWLLPVAGICCLAAFIGWMLVEHFRREQDWGEAVISGVGYAIAIAAVSCPCALAIAVTLVTSIAISTTVNDGVLFRSVQALLQVHSIKSVAFDKTGTLSQGVMSVQQTLYDKDPLSLQLLRAITASSDHPVSETVKRHLGVSADLEHTELEAIEIFAGQGVSATFYGFPLLAGNASFTRTQKHPLVQQYLASGLTILVVTLGGQLIGLFGMKDQPRPGADRLVADLERDGKVVSLVSGDNVSAVHAFARDLGITLDSTHAAQSPTSKAQVVQNLEQQQEGKVAFVGDGINDIIALSTADFSIATGSASNASSQIIILASDVPKAMRTILSTSRLARNHVIASLAFCGVYFAVAILLASGVTGWRIPPAYAGLGELVSSLPVLVVGAHLAVYRALKRRFSGSFA